LAWEGLDIASSFFEVLYDCYKMPLSICFELLLKNWFWFLFDFGLRTAKFSGSTYPRGTVWMLARRSYSLFSISLTFLFKFEGIDCCVPSLSIVVFCWFNAELASTFLSLGLLWIEFFWAGETYEIRIPGGGLCEGATICSVFLVVFFYSVA